MHNDQPDKTQTHVLITTIANAWPMLVFILVTASLSGIIIWFLVSWIFCCFFLLKIPKNIFWKLGLSLYGVPPILPMTYTETPIRLTKRELFSATPRVWETKCLVFVESVSMMCTYWLSGRARRKDICLEVMTQRLSAARSVRHTKTNNKETQIIKTESTFWATSRSIHPRVLRHWEVQLGNT